MRRAGSARSAAAAMGLAVLGLTLTGCATATRPIVEPSTQSLAETKRGVAVVKFSMPNEICVQHWLLIGVREGNGHRLVKTLTARGGAPATTANAAEAELAPGEYQVLGYICKRARTFLSAGNEGGPYTPSLGSFTVAAGEVVNIGHVTFQKAPGGPHLKVAVGDWAASDLKRFRDERPQLFAAMQTRLLQVKAGQPLTAEEKQDRCGELAALKAAGKVQQLPKGCA